MIIGNGSLAKLLEDRVWFLFFAAGASNSSNVTESDVVRESLELGRQLRHAHDENLMFVYFSSISVFFNDNSYTRHKKNMENIVRSMAKHYTIIRLGNIWECTNPNTFLNAFKTNPNLQVRDEYKYMISKQQLLDVTSGLRARGQHEISVFGEMLKVSQCLQLHSSVLPSATDATSINK